MDESNWWGAEKRDKVVRCQSVPQSTRGELEREWGQKNKKCVWVESARMYENVVGS